MAKIRLNLVWLIRHTNAGSDDQMNIKLSALQNQTKFKKDAQVWIAIFLLCVTNRKAWAKLCRLWY